MSDQQRINNTGFSIIGSARIINTGFRKENRRFSANSTKVEMSLPPTPQSRSIIISWDIIRSPSTQIAENLDLSGARGEHNIRLIAAEGEHSAAGICYGASAGGGRVFNATSANGLLYALEQFPVQSGTRMPMVMNVACRTVSGPLCIKGDHSDIMYLLNTGWIILFADDPQMVYDFNLIALKLAEKVNLPVVVAFDGFFTSHQKQKCMVFSEDETVQHFIGKNSPVTIPKSPLLPEMTPPGRIVFTVYST